MRLFCVVLALISVAFAANCTMSVLNTLTHDSILLCGRTNGGIPGARFATLLAPGKSTQWPCPLTTATNSFETYFTIRNDTKCQWDPTCPVPTGTCQSYPWLIGEGVSWQDGYWYGFLAANFDGAGLGWQGNYGSKSCSYGIQMNCSSYGVTPWSGTCGVKGGQPWCTPDVPNFNLPGTGVVACGPKQNEGVISLVIFNSP